MGPILYGGKDHALLTCGILFCLFGKRVEPTLIMYGTWDIPRRNETPVGGGLDDPVLFYFARSSSHVNSSRRDMRSNFCHMDLHDRLC